MEGSVALARSSLGLLLPETDVDESRLCILRRDSGEMEAMIDLGVLFGNRGSASRSRQQTAWSRQLLYYRASR